MKSPHHLCAIIVGLFVLISASALAVPTDVFISEYIEGSSYNKSIEIYNGTGSTINLENYTLELYSNGAVTPTSTHTFGATDSVAHTDVFVISHTSAAQAILDVSDATNGSVINFNGNDALVLKNASSTVIDSIGDVGNNADFGADVTYVKKATIETGDTTVDDNWAWTDWDSYASDTTAYLGSHTGPVPVELDSFVIE